MNFIKKYVEKCRRYLENHAYGCDVCKAEIFDYPQKRICNTCDKNLLRAEKLVCPKCGRITRAQGVCLTCKARVPAFNQGFSPFAYTGVTASVINRFKNGEKRLAWFLGEQMADIFLRCNDEENLLIVPVPLTATRRKERGYNQAEELAKTVARVLEEGGRRVGLDFEILQQRRELHSQKQLGYFDREENVAGAYHVHKRKACVDKTILLIDDVMTTSATGSACAKLLLGAGARKVYLLTSASVPEQK